MASVKLLLLCAYASALSVNYIPKSGSPPSQREIPGLAHDSSTNKVYIYGGRSEDIHKDMWEFDLSTKSWSQIRPVSAMSPGARSGAYLTVLEESRQIVLFGGDTEDGPVSDVWLYDIDSEIVIFTQWELSATKGKAPPRAYYRAVCGYMHDGKRYIAVYGGKNRTNYVKSLFILDLETLVWTKLSDSEMGPNILSEKMDYYDGSFYIFQIGIMYVYNLDSNLWTQSITSGMSNIVLQDYPQCIYEGSLYLVLGWDDVIKGASNMIYKIDISGNDYKAEQITIPYEGIAESLFGYSCEDNLLYLFGGTSDFYGYSNNLSILDLSKPELEFEILSKVLSVPTARKGHAMQAYNDKIYIFGGVDGSNKNILDMWSYDIDKEDWSPISFKSAVVPSPRSDFAHARYQESFIIFGGRGESELLNDLYRYSTKDREWKKSSSQSAVVPSARRASCMAAADNFILIFGGIEASGYSNELWKFDWGTKSYTLLDSYYSPPKAAFSQCHIDKNSEGQMIFKVYIGESEGETPIAFIYEYNLSLEKWFTILEPYSNFDIGRSKSAIFMINDKIISAGGSIWSYASYASIYMGSYHSPYDEPVKIGSLQTATYHAASTYYKNKIYIHGGGYSFGDLPLSSLVKNDLIVINLNQKCEGSDDICIDSCSKGTYYTDEECTVCPMGSYSDIIGSTSCKLCRAGYFSDIIGAETSKTCKPCPYGYFNTKEGQFRCLNCPKDSTCSLDQIIPSYKLEIITASSVQPDLLNYETETVSEQSKNFYIVISLIMLICIVMLLTFKKTQVCLKNIDMYSLKHNYDLDQPMYIRKTLIGGIFTTAFVFAALAIIFSMFLSYAIDNIRETKALVPLAALEQQYDNFAAEVARFEFEFKAYGGECGSGKGKCNEHINIYREHNEGTIEDLTCELIDSNCKVSFIIRDFELTENGKVGLKLSEPQSLSSGILFKLETSSSIPDSVSSHNDMIWSDRDYFFRGSVPSTFSYLMTPSLFKTDSNKWEDDQRGYHISLQEDPMMGSQINISE